VVKLDIELELLRDAEPGTGLGTEGLDGLVPRDERGLPVLPASHIKGLLRDRLEAIAVWLDRAAAGPNPLLPVIDALVGRGGEDGADGELGCLRLTDLRLPARASADPVMAISRTALGALGTAHGQSLRTVEAVRAGQTFVGHVHLAATLGDARDLACRLGLMAIEAVGSGRTRGAGLCRIAIRGETRTPGVLLAALEAQLARAVPTAARAPLAAPAPRALRDQAVQWYRLSFVADAPVCCPETPVLGSNIIRTGPVIPASAVQGALLTLLNDRDPALATTVFQHPSYRAWPLVPVATASGDVAAHAGFGVRVDLAHRMSKLPLQADGPHAFFDSAVAPYHWTEAPSGAALKSSDGVLIRQPDGAVGLWRAQDLPRVTRAHGVHAGSHGERNLFTVEALAPLAFSGLLAIPAEAGAALCEALENGASVCFGKARTVRGSGRLTLQPLGDDAPWRWRMSGAHAAADGRVFIVQSPLALPADWSVGRADEALQRLVAAAGWGELVLGDPERRGRHGGSVATLGIRFGWNRHGLGEVVGSHRRLRARRVVLPGSVLVLRSPLDRIEERLRVGLGEGREQGFGALLPHPGVARMRLPELPKPVELRSEGWARLALQLWREAGGDEGPSASQIGALAQRAQASVDSAKRFLDDLKSRPPRIWGVWEPVRAMLKDCLGKEPADKVMAALRAWQDLRVGNDGEARQGRK
jgi:hypothetical protein